MDALAVLTRQALAVMGVLAAVATSAVAGLTWVPTAAVGAAAVLVVLAALAAALLRRARRCALDLIIEGREWLPLAAVERQRRRLLKRQTRERLATGLAGVLEDALIPPVVPVANASLLALTDGGSALYGNEVRPLREELRHALPAAVASRSAAR